MAMTAPALPQTKLLLGRVVPCVKQNAAKIIFGRMELDTYLLMYFKKFDTVYAYDPLKKCKSGDIVLIKELPEKVTTLITHSVEEIVHKKGDIICPITNKPVVFTKYRYQVDEANKLFGKRSSTFDYEKAPARGRLEGTYDLTDKDSYIKYHEDGEEDPYACYK